MERINSRNLLTLVLLAGLTAACGGGGSDSAGGNGNTTCNPVDIASEPDILGQPTLSTATILAGDSTTLSIPVDADTGYVSVNFYTGFGGDWGSSGGITIPSPAVQTVEVTLPTISGTTGVFYPIINVCKDYNTCIGRTGTSVMGTAVAYTWSTPDPAADPSATGFLRYVYWQDGADPGDSGNQSCLQRPKLTIQ